MHWSKRGIFIFLSFVLISCSSTSIEVKGQNVEEQSRNIGEELVSSFFKYISEFEEGSISIIDSIGFEISQHFNQLTFYPYKNDIDNNSFVFSANHQSDFDVLISSDYLKDVKRTQFENYSVWRQPFRNALVIDISIEPHPIFKWIFVVRYRGQE